MSKICRTCTQLITTNEYFDLDGSSCGSRHLSLKHVLQSCIPELDLNLMPKSVICNNCMQTLYVLYHFKSEAIKNEPLFSNQASTEINREADSNVIVLEIETENEADVEVKDQIYQDTEPTDDDFAHIIKSPTFQNYLKTIGKRVVDDIQIRECPPLVPFDNRLRLQEGLSYTDIPVLRSNSILNDYLTSDKQTSSYNSNPQNIELTEISYLEPVNLIVPDKLDSNYTKIPSRTHVKDKTLHCKQCTYKTKCKLHFKNHMKVHRGERPFKCHTCDKSFNTKRVLHEHKLLHASEKTYKCKQCYSTFKQNTSLDIHISNALCRLCKHMKIYTGVKSHLCSFCGKCFWSRF